MELFIFARFHAAEGQEAGVAVALREIVAASREEPGCRAIEAFRSTRDPASFYIHSRWVDEPAFECHAASPHTVRFLEQMRMLTDHPPEVTRARPVG